MQIENNQLIEDLIQRTKAVMNQAEALRELSLDHLNWKSDSESWSILECLEHLNRYGDFYIPEIKHRIKGQPNKGGNLQFKSGLLGNYFAKSMLPKEQLNKMKTFQSMDPSGSDLNQETIQKFLNQQKQMLELLTQSRNLDLTKTKTSISISNWIKLRLGDTFRVVIYHNQRHMVQIQRIRKTIAAVQP